MKVIACIEDQAVIDKILAHLGNQTGCSAVDSHLPETRAPPQQRLFD